METIALISGLISALNKVLDKMPDYPQKKRIELNALNLALQEESVKKIEDRDDDLLMNLKEKLALFLKDFNPELKDAKI